MRGFFAIGSFFFDHLSGDDGALHIGASRENDRSSGNLFTIFGDDTTDFVLVMDEASDLTLFDCEIRNRIKIFLNVFWIALLIDLGAKALDAWALTGVEHLDLKRMVISELTHHSA